ncbi:hypothetical protein HHI36_004900 [Cryptolaemus montrouzieri]|uniref:Uncharacterized protein n=1 Tax=Cryptolaemus montrouzieri TaxID=559131 RepID=A0ABD2NT56_9CUCU
MALKVLKEKQWQKPNRLPLAEDIENFRAYVSDLANSTYIELRQGKWTPMNYRTLTECVLALTVMFNRKRIGDVQFYRDCTPASKDLDVNYINESLVPSGSEYEPSSSSSETSEKRFHLEGYILTSLCERKPLPLTKHLSPTRENESFQESVRTNSDTTNISDMGKKDETTHNKEDTEEIQQWVEQGIRPLRKKNSARERPIICPICFDDVMTHFTRHLFRHHTTDPCVQNILKLSPKCKERLALVSSMQKTRISLYENREEYRKSCQEIKEN